MPRGAKPGERRGGRAKGTKNKRTESVEKTLESLGCDPIQGMIEIAKLARKDKDYALAGNMYKELAQYVAPKRKAVEISGDPDNPLELITEIELVAPSDKS